MKNKPRKVTYGNKFAKAQNKRLSKKTGVKVNQKVVKRGRGK